MTITDPEDAALRVCYVLAYRAPNYIRTLSLLQALQQTPGVRLYTAINRATGLGRYPETIRKLREIHNHHRPDIYVLGFRGHELYWPVRWLVGDIPIIFDALMSPYHALGSEGKSGMLGTIAAPLWKPIERSILNDADLILTDTNQHIQYYSETFSLPEGKMLALPVGAVEKEDWRRTSEENGDIATHDEMSLLFYGSFLPLHGSDVIIKAAHLLGDLPLRFDFIGGGRAAENLLLRGFPSTDCLHYTYRPWIPFNEIIDVVIPRADLCLGGPFGDTNQARRVITGKTSQCLALGKPTVVGVIDEHYGFENKNNCLLVKQGNPQELADAIRWAWNNRDKLRQIGESGKALYDQRLSQRVIQKALAGILSRYAVKHAGM